MDTISIWHLPATSEKKSVEVNIWGQSKPEEMPKVLGPIKIPALTGNDFPKDFKLD